MKALVILLLSVFAVIAEEPRFGTNQTPADWRAEKRLIDLHLHINYTAEHRRRRNWRGDQSERRHGDFERWKTVGI
jgi:hypothetical protein